MVMKRGVGTKIKCLTKRVWLMKKNFLQKAENTHTHYTSSVTKVMRTKHKRRLKNIWLKNKHSPSRYVVMQSDAHICAYRIELKNGTLIRLEIFAVLSS